VRHFAEAGGGAETLLAFASALAGLAGGGHPVRQRLPLLEQLFRFRVGVDPGDAKSERRNFQLGNKVLAA
jgi:hypothetical protein